MTWWGKMLGGAFGFAIGGLFGALIGIVLGHYFDINLKYLTRSRPDVEIELFFFNTTFSILGHLCKADGRVSSEEIAIAEYIMARMNLRPEQRTAAIDLFNQGKQPNFPFDTVLAQLRRELGPRRNLGRLLLEILFTAACADGDLSPAERGLLNRVGGVLGFSTAEMTQIEALAAGAGRRGDESRPAKIAISDAYATLGVSPSDGDDVVKRAYRRALSQHHPDKLASRGLPPEMIAVANEKTRQIKDAYEAVMKNRNK